MTRNPWPEEDPGRRSKSPEAIAESKSGMPNTEKRFKPTEVEAVLRRSAQLSAQRWDRLRRQNQNVPPEALTRLAAAAGIAEEDVRRAIFEVSTEKTADPPTYQRVLLGPARVRVVREIGHPGEETAAHLEEVLRSQQGLKLRYSAEGSSVWDPGETIGAVRRALELSAERPLLGARSVEMAVEEIEPARCSVDLLADLSGRRAEYLSLAGLLGVTLAILFFFAGIQNVLFLLGVIPALAAPLAGFRLAYVKSRSDMRRELDHVLDTAEKGPPRDRQAERDERPPGQIKGLRPIPRFAPRQDDE